MRNDWGALKGEVLDPAKCKARVSDHNSRWPHYYQCRSKPKRDGYCGTHHPDKVAAKTKASDEAYHAQNRYVDWLYAEKALRLKIADAVIDGADQGKVECLVKDYKKLKAAKPPVTNIPRWRHP